MPLTPDGSEGLVTTNQNFPTLTQLATKSRRTEKELAPAMFNIIKRAYVEGISKCCLAYVTKCYTSMRSLDVK